MKPRKIPAYVKQMDKNEKKHHIMTMLLGLIVGIHMTWVLGVLLPRLQMKGDVMSLLTSYQLIGGVITMVIMIVVLIKEDQYKKLIKLEFKNDLSTSGEKR